MVYEYTRIPRIVPYTARYAAAVSILRGARNYSIVTTRRPCSAFGYNNIILYGSLFLCTEFSCTKGARYLTVNHEQFESQFFASFRLLRVYAYLRIDPPRPVHRDANGRRSFSGTIRKFDKYGYSLNCTSAMIYVCGWYSRNMYIYIYLYAGTYVRLKQCCFCQFSKLHRLEQYSHHRPTWTVGCDVFWM